MKQLIYKTTPWEHQQKALEFLLPRQTGALYTEPGTGKTKVILDLIVNRGWKRGIIVAPPKACDVWQSQFQIHTDIPKENVYNLRRLSTAKKVIVMNTICPKRKRVSEEQCFFLIVNYESIWRPDFEQCLLRKGLRLDFIVCDESHRIKTPSSKCSMCLRRLSEYAPNRYLVTGTPLAENPIDIYAQYRFLDPSIFGTNFTQFKDRYQNLDAQRSMRVGYPVLDRRNPYKNLEELREKMFSCAFQISSSVELPKRLNIVKSYELSSKALKIYKDLVNEGLVVTSKGVTEIDAAITKTLRLQQVCCGFLSIDESVFSENDIKQNTTLTIDHARAELLEELLEQFSKREPIVIFANFRHDFEEIKAVCNKLGRRYTEVSGLQDTLQQWVSGNADVIAVQYRSGSESIDLTRARYCIYYSLTLSLALYLQSKKRIHRPGQTRSCIYYYIVADLPNSKQSKDRQILTALKNKQDVIDYVLHQKDEG